MTTASTRPRTSHAAPGYWQELTETLGAGWNRFWFTPADPLPLSLLRIGVGALAVLYFLSFSRDIVLWFGEGGLLPLATVDNLVSGGAGAPQDRFSIYYGIVSPGSIQAVHWSFVAIAALFACGLGTRVTGALTAIGVLSYVHRAPILSTPAEPLLSMLLIYLVIGPSGRYFSLDRWLFQKAKPEENETSLTANIALRLMQVHFAALVLIMGLAKLSSATWWDGEAIWQMLALTISRPTDLTWLRPYTFLLNAWAHAIVYFELAFPIFIWNRLARPLLLGIGACLWLSIAGITGLAMFAMGMILASLCYIPGATWRKWGIDPR